MGFLPAQGLCPRCLLQVPRVPMAGDLVPERRWIASTVLEMLEPLKGERPLELAVEVAVEKGLGNGHFFDLRLLLCVLSRHQ